MAAVTDRRFTGFQGAFNGCVAVIPGIGVFSVVTKQFICDRQSGQAGRAVVGQQQFIDNRVTGSGEVLIGLQPLVQCQRRIAFVGHDFWIFVLHWLSRHARTIRILWVHDVRWCTGGLAKDSS